MLKNSLFIVLFLFCQNIFAQNQIKGMVSDLETGEFLPYASIFVLEEKQGTSTDENGNFILKTALLKAKIVATFMGYQSDTLLWKKGSHLRFALRANAGTLDEVVVTGTLQEVSKMESSVPVEVYTPKFFLRNPTPSLFDAMQNVNGVRPQINCSVCSTGDIHINGMEGAYTMILIDGMPMVSGLSTVYGLSGIPTSLIQRIEIVKGPAATVYGSEAVGGLINVITKSAKNSPKLSLDMQTTTYQEHNLDVGTTFNFGKMSTLVSANYFFLDKRWDKNNDNFTDVTLSDRFSLFNKWSLERKNNRQANIAFRYFWEDRFGGEMQWTKAFRGGNEIYGENIYTKRYEIMGSYELPFKEKLLFTFSLNHHDQNSVYGTTVFNAIQQISFGQLTWNKEIGKHQILSGTALRYTFYDDNTPITSDLFSNNMPSKTILPGIFIQDEISLNEKHKIMPGVRYDYNSNNGSIFTPRMSYKFSPNFDHTFRLTYGTGYRVAYVFSEDHAALTGGREVVVSKNLKPERSQNINLNYVSKFFPKSACVTFDASLFFTYYNNKIVADFLTDPNKVIFDNLKEYGISRGFSLNTDIGFANGLKVVAGFTAMEVYTIAKDNFDVDQKIPQLQTPNLTANWSVSYTIPKLNLNIDYTGFLNSPMLLPVLENDFRSKYSPWFSIQNIQLSKKIANRLEIYGGIKNLLDFVPKNPIMRPFDPFDKKIDQNNPNGYTFDPTYGFASMQGIRGFLGIRLVLPNKQ